MSAVTSSNAGPQKRKPGVRGERVNYKRLTLLVFLTCWTVALSARSQETSSLAPGEKPADAPPQWKEWIGEYGPDNFIYSVRESQGRIWISSSRGGEWQFTHAPIGRYEQAESANGMPLTAKFDRAANGVQSLITGDVAWSRRSYGVDAKNIAHIRPARSIEELRKEAFATSPPVESGSFRKPELVEPSALDASIHLDIRYATANDFLGTPVYSQARAFLQRPAAEALLRVQQKLKPLGYGLLIHDAYRPWYVTKIFWDATPPEGKIFVADPAQGSRHNRGCAVDLTLYDLATGKLIEMPGTYDEMSHARFRIIPAALRSNGGTAICFATPWSRKASRSTRPSGGILTTRTGGNTRS